MCGIIKSLGGGGVGTVKHTKITLYDILPWRFGGIPLYHQIKISWYMYSCKSILLVVGTRISHQGALPMVSELLIRPVSTSLNGTKVNCTEVHTTVNNPDIAIWHQPLSTSYIGEGILEA